MGAAVGWGGAERRALDSSYREEYKRRFGGSGAQHEVSGSVWRSE